MVGWKGTIRIILGIFWTITILLSLTGYGFLTYLFKNHVTTSIVLLSASVYFLIYPLISELFPKITTNGGEKMEISSKVLAIIIIVIVVIVGLALTFPTEIISFLDGTIWSGLIGAWLTIVGFFDGFRGSYMLAGGLIFGLVSALVIKKLDVPKRYRMKFGKPKTAPQYQGPPSYTPPQAVQPVAPAPQPVQQTVTPTPVTPPVEETKV